MRTVLNLIITLTCISFQFQSLYSQQVSLELDPAPYLLNGYSVSLRYSLPSNFENFSIMGSIYESEFPDAMMSQVNKDNGWTNLEFRTSYAIFIDYFFKASQRGFYFGTSIFYYNKSVELINSNEKLNFSSIYPNIRVGYIWYPFENVEFYINPWTNVGTEVNIGQKNKIGNKVFEPNSFNYIVALHLGYSFNLIN